MDRLTKAAIATGGAALLLLGGAGTMAYWNGSATATGQSITSGTLTATGSTCTPWAYSDGTAASLVVPGDTLTSSCTVTVKGTGDHLAVTAKLANSATWKETNALAAGVTLTTSAVTVDGAAVPTTGFKLAGGTEHKVNVTVTATFPFGDATTTSTNTTQNLTATLNDVVVGIEQVKA